ncbi:MAG: hypothetical protein NTW29_04670 [Bacteroidetes bacterium]|nr:hypothetical protein [Bacteroidota bacterium]
MRKYYSILISVFLFSGKMPAQFISPGRYLPADKSVLHTSLRLYKDSHFIYTNNSSGSCWVSVQVQGTWRVNRDTLYLDIAEKNESRVYTRKYIVKHGILSYIDPVEKDIFINWGPLVRDSGTPSVVKIKSRPSLPVKGIRPEMIKPAMMQTGIHKKRTRTYLSNTSVRCRNLKDIWFSQTAMLNWSEADESLVLEVFDHVKSCFIELTNFRYRSHYVIRFSRYRLQQLPDAAIIKTFHSTDNLVQVKLKRDNGLPDIN